MSEDGSLLRDILARHSHSSQPESIQLCAIVKAVVEVIKAEGMQPSPTAIFGAAMTALERPETRSSAEVLQAMLTLLTLALGRVPDTVIRFKYELALNIITGLVQAAHAVAGPLKPAISCLSQILRATDPLSDFAASEAGFGLLLRYALDERPKVRKRADSGVVEVLAGLQKGPAKDRACEVVVAACTEIFAAPETAARAAADASKKHRTDAESAIEKSVSDALHLLGLMRQCAPLLTEAAAVAVAQAALRMFPLGQPLINRHVADVLMAMCSAATSPLGPRPLSDLVSYLVAQRDLWDRKDVEAVAAMTRLVQQGCSKLAELDAARCAAILPSVFHALVPQLSAEQDGVRLATAEALRALTADCIDPDMVQAALISSRSAPSALHSIVAAVGSALGARYQEAWALALPTVAALIEKLGKPGAPLAAPLVDKIGEFLAGAFDATEADQQMFVACAAAAEDALGAALRALGPSSVLAALPLDLEKGLDGTGEARTWLLPLLKDHVRGCQLASWSKLMLPVGRSMGSRCSQYTAKNNQTRAKQSRALEQQVWLTLPAFASWCTDLGAGFSSFSKELGAAFQNRPDLRPAICAMFERAALQTREAARALGLADELGLAAAHPLAPSKGAGGNDDDAGSDDGGGVEAGTFLEGPHAEVPEWFTEAHVRSNLAALRGAARAFLQTLFTAFVASPPESRQHLARAIAAMSLVADRELVSMAFQAVGGKLLRIIEEAKGGSPAGGIVLEGGSTVQQRRATFLELSLCLAGGLDAGGVEALFSAARPCLTEPEASVQKKGYRLLSYILEGRKEFAAPRAQQLVDLILGAGRTKCLTAARRFRLRTVSALVDMLASGGDGLPEELTLPADGDMEDAAEDAAAAVKLVAARLLSEVVMGVKEPNKRTRAVAYDLLVSLGHRFEEMEEEAAESMEPSDSATGLDDFFNMVLAGLVGTTPHMISATVMALARLLYEFAPHMQTMLPQLMPAVLMLLRTKSREVVQSVLGFVKVAVMRLPAEDLKGHLKEILEGMLLWASDSKNRFKLKVRVVVERLAKRCGYEAVAACIPESDSKLLTHIRKEQNRKQRRRDGSEAGDEGDMEDDTRSLGKTSMAHTARASEWAASRIFSDDEGGDGDARSQKTGAAGRSERAGPSKGGARLVEKGSGGDPMDLLDTHASRRLVKASARRTEGAGDGDEGPTTYDRASDGRLVILDENKAAKRKALGLRTGMEDSEDDDDDIMDDPYKRGARGGRGGNDRSDAKSVGGQSLRSLGVATKGGRSAAGKSRGGGSSMKSGATRKSGKSTASGRSAHDGDRYKSKSSAGDVKGRNKVEPYAYWRLDRRLLNKRAVKKRGAEKGLDRVVKAVHGGVKKGLKAKLAEKARKKAVGKIE